MLNFFAIVLIIFLGILSLKTNLSEPIFVIGHQLNASLLIAILTSLICRNPYFNQRTNQTFNSAIVGLNS